MPSSLANSPSRQGDIGAVFRSLSQRGVGLHDIRPHADTILGGIWVRRGFSGEDDIGQKEKLGRRQGVKMFFLSFSSRLKKDALFHPFPEREDR